MCRLKIFGVACVICRGRLSFEFWRKHKILLSLGWMVIFFNIYIYYWRCFKCLALHYRTPDSTAFLWLAHVAPFALHALIYQQEQMWLLADPLHRASRISVLHFVRMCSYRAPLHSHNELISDTFAKHYGILERPASRTLPPLFLRPELVLGR